MIRLRAPDLPSKAQRGQRFSVRIVAEDSDGPVSGLMTEATASDGAAVIPPLTRPTDTTGQLEIPLLAPREPGPITLIVASPEAADPLFILVDVE